MIDDMTQMLDLGMFSEFEKTIIQENKIRRRQTRKKLVATVKRCERVYKRTDEPSELFCERGGTVQRVIDFLKSSRG